MISQQRLFIVVMLAAICAAVAIEQVVIARVNGWWADELFALWASDRSTGFVELFRVRIASDSNPPLFFSLLHLVRLLVPYDRAAVVALNIAALAAGLLAVLSAAWRSRYRDGVVLSFALFALGGPAAAYIPEARAYCLAMTASYVAVILSALVVLDSDRSPNWKLFVIVGVVAGLSHVFAALLCCALAAALYGVDILSKRFRPSASATALAASAMASSLVWILVWSQLGPGTLGQVGWIPFTASFVWLAGLGALALTFGTAWLAVPFGLVIASGWLDDRSRRLALMITFCATSFVVVPILISYRVPIILTRYWIVGSPLLLAPLALLIGCWRSGPRPATRRIVATAMLIAISLLLSFFAALDFVAAKPIWRGIPIVTASLPACGPNSIHVLGFAPGFSIATGAPPATFVDVKTLQDDTRPAGATCPILGWSEHYVLRFGPDFMDRATIPELLRLLKLDVAPDDVTIDRHQSGFVVRRREP